MALTQTALMGLACLLANNPEQKTTDLYNQLSEADRAQVDLALDNGDCLPEGIEKIFERALKVNGLDNYQFDHAPTQFC
jgi:hypothetical protein